MNPMAKPPGIQRARRPSGKAAINKASAATSMNSRRCKTHNSQKLRSIQRVRPRLAHTAAAQARARAIQTRRMPALRSLRSWNQATLASPKPKAMPSSEAGNGAKRNRLESVDR